MFSLIWQLLVGLLIGVIARLLIEKNYSIRIVADYYSNS